MVPAGQWQAVKDTLSRPNVRSLTTSDTLGNPTTSTTYSNYITTTPCNSYTTTNDTAIYLQILCYDNLDTAISKLWLSLPPIPYVLNLIQQSHTIQQAIKSPFSYCYNNKLQGYNNLKLLYSNCYKLFWYYTPLDTTIYTLPSSYNTASSYVPILL